MAIKETAAASAMCPSLIEMLLLSKVSVFANCFRKLVFLFIREIMLCCILRKNSLLLFRTISSQGFDSFTILPFDKYAWVFIYKNP